MSHNRPKTAGSPINFEGFFYCMALFCCISLFVFAANSSYASVSSSYKTQKNPTYVLKSSLDKMAKHDTAKLDWRTQSFELNFDLPANDWYESLDLFLSAAPQGDVSPNAPLMISFNGTKAIPIYGRGSRFDAHIRLDTSRIRLSGNQIKISYKTPNGRACLTPDNGQWLLDLTRSKLVANAHTKKRNMQIVEIEQRLRHAMTAPNRVRITAVGDNKLAYEALAAQAVSQRMDFVPVFKLSSAQRTYKGSADFHVIMGAHDDIRGLVKNGALLNTKGAQVLIDTANTPTVVLTGETEDQVLELMRAFASYHLPNTRRDSASLQEFYTSKKLAPRPIISANTYKLSDIETPIIAPSWRPDPALINFNVADPSTTSGVLTLNIVSAKDINPTSRMSVKLNDKSIGFTQINKSSKKVEFQIEPGMFIASGNKISIEADLQPGAADIQIKDGTDQQILCQSRQYIPAILVSSASKLSLKSNRPTPRTELSRLAASGAPFDQDALLVLNAQSVLDRQASLRLLGYAAQQFGPKWAQADYVSDLADASHVDKNILIIGPNPVMDKALFSTAPRALKNALGSKVFKNLDTEPSAQSDKFASTSPNASFEIAARKAPSKIINSANLDATRLKSGGLAALFASPYAPGRMVGVISSDIPSKFAGAMDIATNKIFWNALQGSVARWDKGSMLMAQTAVPLPSAFVPPTHKKQYTASVSAWFEKISASKPNRTSTILAKSPPQITTGALPNSKPSPPSPPTPPSLIPYPMGEARVLSTAKAGDATSAEPLKTASSDPNFASAQSASAQQTVQGVLPAHSEKTNSENMSQGQKQPRTLKTNGLSMPKLSTFSLGNIKLKSYQASRDLKSWWNISAVRAFEATPMRAWWIELSHNKTAFFLLIVFFGFFIAALASPMSVRRK